MDNPLYHTLILLTTPLGRSRSVIKRVQIVVSRLLVRREISVKYNRVGYVVTGIESEATSVFSYRAHIYRYNHEEILNPRLKLRLLQNSILLRVDMPRVPICVHKI